MEASECQLPYNISVKFPTTFHQTIIQLIQSDDPNSKIEAAREIRRLTKTSKRHRRQFSGAIEPLVSMLGSGLVESNEAALLALLNLAVKDEQNKIDVVNAGALKPLISFLQSQSLNLREYATAALLTLSASAINKPTISSSGAIPLLVDVLRDGTPQAKIDSVLALYNLFTYPDNLSVILAANAVPPLVNLLKTCKKSSKTAEKCSSLLEPLLGFDEGRIALTSVEDGMLTVVEVLENGSLQSREHAVGALLTMCQSDQCKYREPILKEGVIPGLLELTVKGTPKSQLKAHTLLQLLRDTSSPRSEFQVAGNLNNIVSIISNIDDENQGRKAKKKVAEMVQISMEKSLRHMQQRALVCTTSDRPVTGYASKFS